MCPPISANMLVKLYVNTLFLTVTMLLKYNFIDASLGTWFVDIIG